MQCTIDSGIESMHLNSYISIFNSISNSYISISVNILHGRYIDSSYICTKFQVHNISSIYNALLYYNSKFLMMTQGGDEN